MSGNEEWYNNKELYEKFNKEINHLYQELQKTREIVSKYNGLRENQGEMMDDVENLKQRVNKIENKKQERNEIFEWVRNWGNWLVPIIMLIFYYLAEIAG